jgi:hypothetical protein
METLPPAMEVVVPEVPVTAPQILPIQLRVETDQQELSLLPNSNRLPAFMTDGNI